MISNSRKVTESDIKTQIDQDKTLNAITKKTYKKLVELCVEYYLKLLKQNSQDIVRYQTICNQYINKNIAPTDWSYFFHTHYVHPFINVLNEQLTMNCLSYLRGRLINNTDLSKGEGLTSSELSAIKILLSDLAKRLERYESKGNNSVVIIKIFSWDDKKVVSKNEQ